MITIKGEPYPTKGEHREGVRASAERAFANHRVTVEGGKEVRSWKCQNPRHNTSWFRVVIGPNLVIIYGDIGTLTLRPYTADVFDWAKAATQVEHTLEKSIRPPDSVFLPAEAERALMELEESGEEGAKEQAAKIREAWQDDAVESMHAWASAWFQTLDDLDVPALGDHDHEALLCFHALRWLMDRLEADGEPIKVDP